jgi:hypothetical protein
MWKREERKEKKLGSYASNKLGTEAYTSMGLNKSVCEEE